MLRLRRKLRETLMWEPWSPWFMPFHMRLSIYFSDSVSNRAFPLSPQVEEYPVLEEVDEEGVSQSVPVEMLTLTESAEIILSHETPDETPQHDVIVIVTDTESEDDQEEEDEDDEEEEQVRPQGSCQGNVRGVCFDFDTQVIM